LEKIGLVTITYNSENVLDRFLHSALKQSFDEFMIYIIDNNSSDNTLKLLQKYDDPRIKIVINESNFGVAKANNQGIKLALNDGCSQVLIINNDTEFEEFLIEKMLAIQRKNNCSLVVPRIMFFDTPEIIWYAGGKFIKSKGFLPEHIGNNQKYDKNLNIVNQVDYAPTCCLLVKKEVFEDVGFMDEKYFVYFDDTDFMYRILKQNKHKLFYFSDVVFYHKVGSLTRSFTDPKSDIRYRGNFFIKYNVRNHIYFLKKIGTLYTYLFILFLFFKNNVRFLFSPAFPKNYKTWYLINKSYFQGIFM
tara:strand:+ start:350 stop:1261 length:912 start_codon:yes stop_codon:yes gene_type:complete